MDVPSSPRTFVLTALTLVAFAGNSILCRLALVDGAIDPFAFTALRLAAGALVLAPFLRAGPRRSPERSASGGLAAPGALFGYALSFSLAYTALDTGTGALLLFGLVQVTMIGVGLRAGERLSALGLLGALGAVGGVVWLVAPGVRAPAPLPAAAMAGAGVAWGVYSLLGRGARAPLRANARSFLAATPVALAVLLAVRALAPGYLVWTPRGVLLALVSGGLTSGLGYALWYRALRGHTATSAGIVQLAVPVLAALGGVLLLGEQPSLRLAGAGTLTLGGVAVVLLTRGRAR